MPKVPNVCRICLQEDVLTTPATFADKIIYESLANACAEVDWSDAVPHGLCIVCREELQRSLKFKILCEQSAAKIKNKYWLLVEERREQPEETTVSCPAPEASTASGAVPSCPVPEASTASNSVPSGPWDYDFTRDNFEMSHGSKKPPLKAVFCDVCNKNFKKRNHLLEHMQKVHKVLSKRSMYPCQKCGIVCTEQMALDKHFKEYHKPKPFKCELCQKRFRKAFQMAQHNTQLHGQVPDIPMTLYKPA